MSSTPLRIIAKFTSFLSGVQQTTVIRVLPGPITAVAPGQYVNQRVITARPAAVSH